MIRKNPHTTLEVFVVILCITFLSSLLVLIYLLSPVSFEETWKEIEIPEGATFSKGITILKDNNIIKNRQAFLLLGRITMADRKLKPGFYSLSTAMSPLQIFDYLINGKTIVYSITIPEGSTLQEIRKKFKNTGLFDESTWKLVRDEEFLDMLDVYAPSLEGYIYPDTYNFSKGTEAGTVFKIMVQKMRQMYNKSYRFRAEKLGMTENEVLTLASIIEKEAIFNDERPLISAVYHNRLRKKMRLQADPTVLYGVNKRSRRIGYRDLKRVTPYNTYRINGLPAGPIASPGIKSIEAALYPADVDYLYFVSKNNGRHHFSLTNKEHWDAVINYQLNGKKKILNDKAQKNKADKSGES